MGPPSRGSNPWSGFYHELQADQGSSAQNTGASDCDCSGGNSPCGTSSGAGRGWRNSNPNGLGEKLEAHGHASISNDPFGQTSTDSAGILCVGGTTRRGEVRISSTSGSVAHPVFQGNPYGQSDIAPPGQSVSSTHWFRDPLTATGCANNGPGSDFDFSNGWTVTWEL